MTIMPLPPHVGSALEVVLWRVDHPTPMLEDEAGEVFAMGLQGLLRPRPPP
jgi:hypothetical protein